LTSPSTMRTLPTCQRCFIWVLLFCILISAIARAHVDDNVQDNGFFSTDGFVRKTGQLILAGTGLNLRVTRGMGPKGYNKVRLSVITHGPRNFSDFHFTYSSPFKYRWTKWADEERRAQQPYVPERWLHSSLIEVPDGGSRLVHIDGQQVTLRLPKSGGGTRGIFISDPCFHADQTPSWVGCAYSSSWDSLGKLRTLMNGALNGSALDFWMILGDNLYDQNGALTDVLFSQLSLDAKSKFFSMVVGNHDMWVNGAPRGADKFDQHGIGMMQYYALDPVSSLHDNVNFLNFSINPDDIRQWHTSMNAPGNLVWYHMLGDVAFVGLSGAFPETTLAPYLDDACQWLGTVEPRPNWVMVANHWNKADDPEDCNPCPHMDMPSVYHRLRRTPGCQEYGTRLKYQDGHDHCNHIQEREPDTREPIGFMIGGSGMSDCGQWGFEYLDSSDDRLRLYYFELEATGKASRADEVFECIKSFGLPSCTHLSQLWYDSGAESDNILIAV